ncbi:hypothetical protein BVH01_13250 [Pseudomonas sp. PA1(2017)]|uniref:hypothetical protein n=1 Tax=Pseudomonas sp. PA1(2017) TaxID=1932113 RepID=UPI00095BB034|nr:hypothetical protein [Pseudomonas sp. PA1(2017)]OLU17495.1 hypothetical protein BVH01_13250 [Pseudomonas sp. PA1(2017)]
MAAESRNLRVQQVNCFYNYAIGLDVTRVDLLKTAKALLKSGTVRTVCFSDLKAIYLDEHGEVKLEWLRPKGRRWDNSWTVQLSDSLPQYTAEDLIFCLELAFHERRIEGDEVGQVPPHLRAALPPVVLENDDLTLPVYPWLKLHADGLMCICFQLDTTWDDLSEEDFISDVVNLFQRYFKSVWVEAALQRIDGEQLLLDAFEGEISIGGQGVDDRRTRKLVKKMRLTARTTLDNSLGKEGRCFDLHGEPWLLHQIAGSEDQMDWEGTIDLCRSIYANAVASQVVSKNYKKNDGVAGVQLWQGRPSVSLMRFAGQPKSKDQLFEMYGQSMSRILMRSPEMTDPPHLPPDLRPFNDYCLHGNRAVLLWTWLRPLGASDNAWDDPNTRAHLLENQARAEHFEYHNIRIARACAIAEGPPSDEQLVYAYETLANADSVIHKSSQAGEITDALEFLMTAAGTTGLIASGKEQARWFLDERRYKAEKQRSRMDRWLTAVFGIVGAAGLADIVFKPMLQTTYPGWVDWLTGLAAFATASFLIVLLAMFISAVNKIWIW